MRQDCAKLVYYSCFFVACFACLGTFASFLLSKNNESLNREANEYVKILCPSVLVLSFVVMWIVRCSTKKPTNSAVQQAIPYGVSQPGTGNNPAFLCDDFFLGTPPSYDETINIAQSRQIDPPPKYEDIARQGWKPEDLPQQEHNCQHRSSTGAEIFTITLPRRAVDYERGFPSDRDIGIHRSAAAEAEQVSERGSYFVRHHPLERCVVSNNESACQTE